MLPLPLRQAPARLRALLHGCRQSPAQFVLADQAFFACQIKPSCLSLCGKWTKGRTEQKIVFARRSQSVLTRAQSDLRPMPNLVHQNVPDKLSRRSLDSETRSVHRMTLVPIILSKSG